MIPYIIGLVVGIVFTIAVMRTSTKAREITGVYGASIGDQDDGLGNRNNKFKN